jgi:beta-glucosidase
VACDHLKRYQRDVALLRELGVDAYRFSISWPRVQPGGRGPLARGLAFYDRLIDELLGAGITPWVTLYHWDLPEELQNIGGGWAGRGIVDAFVDYAVSVHVAFGDRVRFWATLNEPWCSAWLGYGSGLDAPAATTRAGASHHLLLAHGRSVAAGAGTDHRFGILLNLSPVAADPRLSADVAPRLARAVRRIDALHNRWWLDALFTGQYPDDAYALLERYLDGLVTADDLAEIGEPLDFLGINYYNDTLVTLAAPVQRDDVGEYPGIGEAQIADPSSGVTSMGWPITPEGLRRVLVRVAHEYPAAPALVVTANGSAWADPPEALAVTGPVPDPRRVAYLRAHLRAVTQAVAEGVDVGYFAA